MTDIPDLSEALDGWTFPVTIQKVTQKIVNFQKTEIIEELQCPANIQPLSPEKIKRLPEEYRGRKLWSIILQSRSIYLEPNNIIVDPSGVKYRIANSSDWRSSGFTKYLAERDYDK